MTKFVILRPVEPPRICYLWEAIQWRAFGAYPTAHWDYKGNDWREKPEDPELFNPPIPDDPGDMTYLSEEQTAFAGLPPDPSFEALMNDTETSSVDHYDRMIAMFEEKKSDFDEEIIELKTRRAEAESFLRRYADWKADHAAYVDQFHAELLLALRRGDLVATGRKLPRTDRARTEKLFERLGCFTEDLEPESIPQDCWVSSWVDWRECSLTSPNVAYVWISVTMEDMLRIFPPSDLIPPEKVIQTGETYAIAERAFASSPKPSTGSRGRPPLPWQGFYVEVARMFRDGEMPEKKEAAIQHFQTWFEIEQGLKASRSAIGQKLKPFYDKLK